jgi:hypothetical protein
VLFLISFKGIGDNGIYSEDTTIKDVLKTFEDFYLKKDYPNALLTLEKSGLDLSPGIKHYNLGTVHAQMQHWSEARFHFLKAEKEGFNNPALFQNEKLVEAKLDITRLEQPLNVSDYFIKYGNMASEGILTSLSLLFLVIGLWNMKKRAQLKVVGVFLPLMILSLVLNFWIKSWSWAIVGSPISLQDGPSSIFGNHGELPEGILIMTKQKGDWREVIYPSRFRGWIKNNGLKDLESK